MESFFQVFCSFVLVFNNQENGGKQMQPKLIILRGNSGSGDSDIMMTDTINPLKSKFKGFHKTFKQDDLGLSLSSFLLN